MRVLMVGVVLVMLLLVIPTGAQQPSASFHIFGDDLQNALAQLYDFHFFRTDTTDLEPRPDGQRGSGRWCDTCVDGHRADRIAYNTAYTFWEHQDPGMHNYLTAIRFFVQVYDGPVARTRIVDSRMTENPFNAPVGETQGVSPYPYEIVTPLPPDRSRPGGVLEFFHQRPLYRVNNQPRRFQILATFTIPALSPIHPGVRWYYQLGGLFVAELDGFGPIARVIVSGMHPSYSYRVQGVATSAPF